MEPLLEVISISISSLLNEVNFHINSGSILGVFGANGSGKSTLLKSITGIPTGLNQEGWIRFRGQILPIKEIFFKKEEVVYFAEPPEILFPMSVFEYLNIGHISISQNDFEKVLKKTDSLKLINQPYLNLSSGEKQRVQLARVLLQRPQVTILDESLSQQDLSFLTLLGNVIKEESRNGMSWMIVSHDLTWLLNLCDSALFLKDGNSHFYQTATEVTEIDVKNLFSSPQSVRVEKGSRWSISSL
ncbi:MAG: hypothetical protein CL678_08820 [Bdellovibrionaceae bacterium]|nr:hypothetical protein [Pseudobdellovibrionaceae bacterium]|tara:strand:- start:6349 stop:7080 length:732 start_codon:yes stop_codon:yes gene_type:complete